MARIEQENSRESSWRVLEQVVTGEMSGSIHGNGILRHRHRTILKEQGTGFVPYSWEVDDFHFVARS